MNNLNELLEDGELLLKELKIDDTSLYTLNDELKRQSILQAEMLLLLRYAKIKLNELENYEEELTARMIESLCKKAEAAGKPISSTAKDKLKKTDLPLYPKYRDIRKKVAEAEAEVSYLQSLQFILSKRAELLMSIVSLDRNRVLSEATLHTDVGMEARKKLYEKKIKSLT